MFIMRRIYNPFMAYERAQKKVQCCRFKSRLAGQNGHSYLAVPRLKFSCIGSARFEERSDMRIRVMKTLRAHSERRLDAGSRAAPVSIVKRQYLLCPTGGSCPKHFTRHGSPKSHRPRSLCLASSSTTRIPIQPGATSSSTAKALAILCKARLQSERHASPGL